LPHKNLRYIAKDTIKKFKERKKTERGGGRKRGRRKERKKGGREEYKER
jgi:hypothetical protein